MTPENAISIIKQVKDNWSANGKDHDNFGLAIQVLEAVVVQNGKFLEDKQTPKEVQNGPTKPETNQDKAQP